MFYWKCKISSSFYIAIHTDFHSFELEETHRDPLGKIFKKELKLRKEKKSLFKVETIARTKTRTRIPRILIYALSQPTQSRFILCDSQTMWHDSFTTLELDC